MRRVIRWTFFEDELYPETEWPISDKEERDYEQAVIQAIRDNGYRITGFAHQGDRFCTPVFDDGKRYCCTFRQWGGLMAEALGLGGEYAYARWAWAAPEKEKHPDQRDWNEDPGVLSAQAARWEKDRERMTQELMRDLATLEKLEARDKERERDNDAGDRREGEGD